MMTSLHDQLLSSEINQRPGGLPERRERPRHRLWERAGTLGWSEDDERITRGMTVVDISALGRPCWPTQARRWTSLSGSGWNQARPVRRESKPGWSRRPPRPVECTSYGCDSHPGCRWKAYSTSMKNIVSGSHIRTGDPRQIGLARRGPGEYLPRRIAEHQWGRRRPSSPTQWSPPGNPVWLTLAAESALITPVESRLVAVSNDASGLRIARLRFVEACPMHLFELAVHGTLSQP